jgi:hypothetical protein
MVVHHGTPPVLLDVVFQLCAVRAVVIYPTQTVIDLAGRVNKPILFAMGNEIFEKIAQWRLIVVLKAAKVRKKG